MNHPGSGEAKKAGTGAEPDLWSSGVTHKPVSGRAAATGVRVCGVRSDFLSKVLPPPVASLGPHSVPGIGKGQN